MAYNPLKEFTPAKDLATLPYINIERQSSDIGEDWQYHHRLIENMLRHHEEVADCSVDADGQTVYVVLNEETYDTDDIERIATYLRKIIGKIACFNYSS